jgi:hypothetical protein
MWSPPGKGNSHSLHSSSFLLRSLAHPLQGRGKAAIFLQSKKTKEAASVLVAFPIPAGLHSPGKEAAATTVST